MTDIAPTPVRMPDLATSYPYDDHADAQMSLRGHADEVTERLSEREIVDLDEERKAAMVGNLLVVLCGDRANQPIVNAGSLY